MYSRQRGVLSIAAGLQVNIIRRFAYAKVTFDVSGSDHAMNESRPDCLRITHTKAYGIGFVNSNTRCMYTDDKLCYLFTVWTVARCILGFDRIVFCIAT